MPSPDAADQPAATAPEVDDVPSTEESSAPSSEDAMAAVQIGLYISAVRCLLTYVVAPAAGALGIFLGPLGLVLQVFGAVMSTTGARRLWQLGHRARIPYAALACAVCALAVYSFVELAIDVLG